MSKHTKQKSELVALLLLRLKYKIGQNMSNQPLHRRALSTVWDIAKITGGITAAWIAYSRVAVPHNVPVNPAVDAERFEFTGQSSTFLSYYAETNGQGRPLILLHSVNATGNAYEMKPIFDHYRLHRPVYALDLPGFGFSERSQRVYSTDLYVGAILDFLKHVGEPCDVVALSLTSEFAAIAAQRQPDLFNSLTMISPTGLGQRTGQPNVPAQRRVHQWLSNPLWAQPLFDLLTTQFSIHYFLQQNFVGAVDAYLERYAWLMSHQPGARHAPLYFISGQLFTADIYERVYLNLQIPTLVLFDTDPNTSFDRLASLLEKNENWRARRVMQTRGLPQFERLPLVTEAMDDFWQDVLKPLVTS
jgi:pimeloyl-ACP methyl ester carboxylesterase